MLTELDALHDKLQAVQAVLEALRQENLRLRTQLSASEQQVQSLAQRIEQASSRLDTLLKQSEEVRGKLQAAESALASYNRAIELTRLINNKLVLGFSLVEKGTVLLETGDWEELKRVATEAATLADELGNPDLHFEAQLLAVKADFAAGHAQGSHNRLLALLPHAHTPDQEAAVRYELFRIDPLDANSHLRALQLYQKLYRETPRYLFKFRLDILERLVVS